MPMVVMQCQVGPFFPRKMNETDPHCSQGRKVKDGVPCCDTSGVSGQDEVAVVGSMTTRERYPVLTFFDWQKITCLSPFIAGFDERIQPLPVATNGSPQPLAQATGRPDIINSDARACRG